jgi:hypothetical protein
VIRPPGQPTPPGEKRWWIVAVLLLVLVACGPTQSTGTTSVKPQGGATIAAEPNPVPAGNDLGSTTINWRTGDGTSGQVYVAEDGGAENLFASGPEGSESAPWIRAGSTYEFRLYSGSAHTTQLASVKVTHAT